MPDASNSGLDAARDAIRAVQCFIEDHGRDSDIGEMIGGGRMGGIDDVFVEFTDENYEKLAGLARDAGQRMEDADLVTGDPSESIHVFRLHAAYNELRRIRLRPERVGDDLVLIQGTVLTLSEVLQNGINAVGKVLGESTAAVTTPAGDVKFRSAAGSSQQIAENAPQKRLKLVEAEPLVKVELARNERTPIADVARALGCSVGLVAKTAAWMSNQEQLRDGRQPAPAAVALNAEAVNADGATAVRQEHEQRERQAEIDDSIDAEEQDLSRRISAYQKAHPDATPREVALAVQCTAGDVERRQATLDRLALEQADEQREDMEVDDANTKRGKRQQWVRKQV